MRRVVVTGMGMVTPLGDGVETNWNKLMAAESGTEVVAVVRKMATQAVMVSAVVAMASAPSWARPRCPTMAVSARL